jgi:sec-independent protein translocase protein TatA
LRKINFIDMNIFAFIGNLGGWEMALIVFVVLLLFGAKKIPDLARGLGRGIREFKDATKEIKSQVEEGIKEEPKQ